MTGMNCAPNVSKIEETLLSLPDVENAKVNLKKGIARVKFDETGRAADSLMKSIKKIGYEAESIN
ncbi:cation transporter [Salinicoccus roseus]|uniref:cation transporter n=1 Tax=Salinicoccus roseus TaxID=45670 RepID=UPI003563C123